MPSSPNRNVDGGWAYMVALGTFINFFLTTGFARSFGIMYSAFLVTFRQSDSTTSLLLGVRSACGIVAGPLSTSLSERFTERKVVIVGAIITSLGFSLSFFATSLEFLIGTIGVLLGVGSTLLLGPTMVAMGKYFDKRRSRAITLTSCGGCVGMIVVPILLQKLIEVYSVRGALLIYGGLSLHLLITGALIRPMTVDFTALTDSSYQSSDLKPFESFEVIVEPTLNSDSKDDNDNDSILHNPGINERHLDESTEEDTIRSTCELPGSEVVESLRVVDNYCDTTELQLTGSSIVNPDHLPDYELRGSSDTDCFIQPQHPTGKCNAFYSVNDPEVNGNSLRLAGETPNPTLNRKCGLFSRCCQSVLNVSQFSILKNPLFIIILISGTVSGIPYACTTMYLVPLIESNGISRDSAAILLSVIGASDIIGRIVCGGLADRKPIQPQHVMIVFGIISGILCSLLVLVSDFYGFLAILIPYGVVCSAQTILVMPATVKLIGLAELPKAVGVLIFFFGVFASIAPYLLGLLKDYTGNYRTIFPLLGCLNICGSLVLLLEGVIRRRIKTRPSG